MKKNISLDTLALLVFAIAIIFTFQARTDASVESDTENKLIPMQTAPSVTVWSNNQSDPAEAIYLDPSEILYVQAEIEDPSQAEACYEIKNKTTGDNRQGWCDIDSSWVSPDTLPGTWLSGTSDWQGSFDPAGDLLTDEGYQLWFKDLVSGLKSNSVIVGILGNLDGASCSGLTEGTAIPSGFGSPFDVFSANNTLLINLSCRLSSADVLVGNGSNLTYVYDTGYTWQKDHWEPYSLNCDIEKIDRSWCIGSAAGTANGIDMSEVNYLLAYTCQWLDNEWKCGCRDQACADQFWQVQIFQGE